MYVIYWPAFHLKLCWPEFYLNQFNVFEKQLTGKVRDTSVTEKLLLVKVLFSVFSFNFCHKLILIIFAVSQKSFG